MEKNARRAGIETAGMIKNRHEVKRSFSTQGITQAERRGSAKWKKGSINFGVGGNPMALS